jgi:hypothetical protein
MRPLVAHAVAGLVCLSLVSVAGQTGSLAGTGRIAGAVVADGEAPARPIRRVVVTMTGTGIATPRQVITDDAGRFAFSELPAGRFSLTAEKPAYLKTYFGNRTPGRAPGMPIALAAGQQIDTVSIPIARGAAIGGRVTDELGTPLSSAQVQISLITFVNGERRLVPAPSGTNYLTTDDRGAFRAYGLLPGDYVVLAASGGGGFGGGSPRLMTADEIAAAMNRTASAPVAPSRPLTRVATYYPHATDPALAQTITLAIGDDRNDIDIVSAFAARTVVHVTGTASGPDGQPLSNISVGIANLSTGSLTYSRGVLIAKPDGSFRMPALSPGRWLLFGGAAESDAPENRYSWWTSTEIAVGDQDLTGVALRFERGSTVRGRLVFQGTQPPPDVTRLRVSLAALPAIADTAVPVPAVVPGADGTFAFEGVPPGKYRVALSAAGAWSLRSAMSGGRDTLDQPLEVAPGQDASLTLTLTDRPTELSGVLLDQLGRPAPEYSVVVISADRALWTTSPRRNSGVVKLGSDGRYRVTGLPPGEYLLCVLTDIEPGQLRDQSFLEQIAVAGVRVTLAEGEKKTQDLRIGG